MSHYSCLQIIAIIPWSPSSLWPNRLIEFNYAVWGRTLIPADAWWHWGMKRLPAHISELVHVGEKAQYSECIKNKRQTFCAQRWISISDMKMEVWAGCLASKSNPCELFRVLPDKSTKIEYILNRGTNGRNGLRLGIKKSGNENYRRPHESVSCVPLWKTDKVNGYCFWLLLCKENEVSWF